MNGRVIKFEVGEHYRVTVPAVYCRESYRYVILVKERAELSNGITILVVDEIPCPYQYVMPTLSEGKMVKVKLRELCGGSGIEYLAFTDNHCTAMDKANLRWC